ncbi:MAG: extracellular solute-binding protein [Pseudomonadota bacterium]|nr:extracellular solute-binding protein [Pseudomonadota bacterium]
MNVMRKVWRVMLGVAFITWAVPSWAQSLGELAAYKGADRTPRLIAGARKEGSLFLYTTTPVEYLNLLTQDFEKRYAVKVNVWRARSEVVLQKVLSEARGGTHNVDVIQSIAPPMEALHRENLLQAITSPGTKDLIPDALPAHHEWVATLRYVFVQAYNTTQVRKEELPKRYEDLLDSKWKGRLGIEASDHEWFYSVVQDMGEERGIRFFCDLVAKNGLSTRAGHPLLTNLVASGEVPLALTVYNYSPEQARQKGAPIDWFAIEPAIAITDGIAVAKRAPHPHAALLFYDYMIGEDAQKILARIGYVPTHRNVESPLKGVAIKSLGGVPLLDSQSRSNALFDDIVMNKRPCK